MQYEDLKKINNNKLYLGATLIDHRLIDVTNEDIYANDHHVNKKKLGGITDIILATMWHNGLKSISKSEGKFSEFLKDKRYLNTCHFYQPDYFDSIMYHFRWYKDQRICSIKDEKINNFLYANNILHKKWQISPLHIKYILYFENSNDVPGFLYIIGGTEKGLDSKEGKDRIKYALTLLHYKLGFSHITTSIGGEVTRNRSIKKEIIYYE